jgi:hypothetical protein
MKNKNMLAQRYLTWVILIVFFGVVIKRIK